MAMEKKILELSQVKFYAPNENPEMPFGGFEGYAAAFNNVDAYNEIIMPGAFKDCIPDLLTHGFVLLNHAFYDLQIGTIEAASEDTYGLKVRCEFYEIQAAQDVRIVMATRMKRGKSVRLSIGYEVLHDEWRKDNIRLLHKIYVHEVSYVNAPANGQAIVSDVKGLIDIDAKVNEGLTLEEEFNSVLATVRNFNTRVKSLIQLRGASGTKAGRKISGTNIQRLETVLNKLNEAADECVQLLEIAKADNAAVETQASDVKSEEPNSVETKDAEPVEVKNEVIEPVVSTTEPQETKTLEPVEPITSSVIDTKLALQKQGMALFDRFLSSRLKNGLGIGNEEN